MKMRERLARAARRGFYSTHGGDYDDWDNVSEFSRNEWLGAALSVLSELEQPTPEMLEAVGGSFYSYDGSIEYTAESLWQAMIRAIREEGE